MFKSPKNKLLRTESCIPPPIFKTSHMIHKEPIVFDASIRTANELVNFWNAYYGTKDWHARFTVSAVYDMLNTEKTTVIGVRNSEREIVATIASVPLLGTFIQQTKEIHQTFYQVECLVLHPNLRNHGFAGWLLGWLDYYTSQHGPVAHCWFRDSHKGNAYLKLPMTAIIPNQRAVVAQISYVSIARINHFENVRQLEWPAVKRLLQNLQTSKEHSFDLVYIPENPKDTTWWLVEVLEYSSCAMVIGIKRTGKYVKDQTMYNTVFTCFVRIRPYTNEIENPFWIEQETKCPYIKNCIEAAAFAQKCDILQVSNLSTCGDPFLHTWKNVRLSNAKRKLYMYNWFVGGQTILPI